jgi:photosystem II stability/assembly factor-like uncharacterized protein
VKHLVNAFLVAAVVSCTSLPTRGVTVSATDLRQNLFAGCFVDQKEGWIVGDLGRIFHTVDGAKTWERLTPGATSEYSFVSIACNDSKQLWAAGQKGQILHSTDAGKTWQPQQSGTDRQLLDIAFTDAHHGMAVGDFGTLLHTDDGGATWTKIALPKETKLPADVAEVVDPGDVVLYSVSFPTPESGWIVGEFGVILASTDGGLTWHPQDSPVERSLFGVHFADQQRGWAVGLESTLLATTDGGISWHKQEVPTPKGFALALYDIDVRGDYGWAVGDSGFLLNSKDAGATWQRVKVPVQMGSNWFRGISLLPEGRGFLIGARGLVLTADRDSFTPLKQRF